MKLFRTSLVILILVFAQCAIAEVPKSEKSTYEALALEAKFEFKAKNYKKAARLFLRIYAETNEPSALFNAGRCYEESKQFALAIRVFKEYLLLKDADEQGKEEARLKIKVLTELIEKQKNAQAIPEKQPQKPATPNKIPQKQVHVPQQTTVEVIKPQQAWPDMTTWISYGSALVLIGTGTAGMISSVNDAKKLNQMNFSASGAKDTYNASRGDITQKYYIFGATCTIGAGLASYATWRLITTKPEEKQPAWNVFPAVNADTSMMVLSGTF